MSKERHPETGYGRKKFGLNTKTMVSVNSNPAHHHHHDKGQLMDGQFRPFYITRQELGQSSVLNQIILKDVSIDIELEKVCSNKNRQQPNVTAN